jgi:hypothetical protein
MRDHSTRVTKRKRVKRRDAEESNKRRDRNVSIPDKATPTVAGSPCNPCKINEVEDGFGLALPPRFDYGDAKGLEEVQEILQDNPIRAF